MRTNGSVTIYHYNGLDTATHLEKWARYNYDEAWIFEKNEANTNKGYDSANKVEVRLPYQKNSNLNSANFTIGDIIVKGTIADEINRQQDLAGHVIYNVISITDANFGKNPHIHLGGK